MWKFWNYLKSYENLENLQKKIFFRNSRFLIQSVFVINVSLFKSVVCYNQNGLRKKHGKCSLIYKWWYSFMNQSLNHLVLYEKCNFIRSKYIYCNKNVDIIWHYCIRYPKSRSMVSEIDQLSQIWRKTHWGIW